MSSADSFTKAAAAAVTVRPVPELAANTKLASVPGTGTLVAGPALVPSPPALVEAGCKAPAQLAPSPTSSSAVTAAEAACAEAHDPDEGSGSDRVEGASKGLLLACIAIMWRCRERAEENPSGQNAHLCAVLAMPSIGGGEEGGEGAIGRC